MFTKTSKKIFASALGILALLVLVCSLARAADQTAAAENKSDGKTSASQSEPDTVDISDVQSQYWKAHDKEFEVIQNKLYSKAGRFELCPLFGIYQSVNYQDTKTYGASLGYYISDMWGFEVMGYGMVTSDSLVLQTLQSTRGVTLEFNSERSYYGGNIQFSPIYGKFSFLGQKISHFNLYISPGGGVTKTVAFRPTYSIGMGEEFWLSNHFNIRVEYRWYHYSDQVQTSQGATAVQNGGPGYYNQAINDQNLMFGIGYLF